MQGGERSAETTASLIDQLIDAGLASRARSRSRLNLSDSDYRALTFLVRSQLAGQRVLQRDIAAALDISTPSTTALVDRLALRGWADRQSVPSDRRTVAVVPTQAAVDAIQEVADQAAAQLRSVTDADDPAATEMLHRLLTRVTAALGS